MQETTTIAIIPAVGEWAYMIFINGVVGHLMSEPIIAWEIRITGAQREVIPITASGAGPGQLSNLWAIRRPDGVYEVPGEATYDRQWDVIDHFKKQTKTTSEGH